MNQTCRSIFGDSHEITAITVPLNCLLIQIMTFLYLYFVLMLFSFNINIFYLTQFYSRQRISWVYYGLVNIMGFLQVLQVGEYHGFTPVTGISWVYSGQVNIRGFLQVLQVGEYQGFTLVIEYHGFIPVRGIPGISGVYSR